MFERTRIRKKAHLNIAPLLDMIFILLLFFVVSTTFSKLPGVNINRPDAKITDKLPPHNLIIGITKEGQYFINKKELGINALKETIDLKSKIHPNLSVVILADEAVQIKHAITAMDICKQASIHNIAIAEERIE